MNRRVCTALVAAALTLACGPPNPGESRSERRAERDRANHPPRAMVAARVAAAPLPKGMPPLLSPRTDYTGPFELLPMRGSTATAVGVSHIRVPCEDCSFGLPYDNLILGYATFDGGRISPWSSDLSDASRLLSAVLKFRDPTGSCSAVRDHMRVVYGEPPRKSGRWDGWNQLVSYSDEPNGCTVSVNWFFYYNGSYEQYVGKDKTPVVEEGIAKAQYLAYIDPWNSGVRQALLGASKAELDTHVAGQASLDAAHQKLLAQHLDEVLASVVEANAAP